MDEPAKADPSASLSLEHTELHLASTLDSVAEIERTAETIAVRMGFNEDTASNLAMVTREAAINACKHGNGFDAAKQVHVTIDSTGTTLTICIEDAGEGLDPSTLPDPLAPANLLSSSGRGVFLMRALMDEVHFRQLGPGTQVTLIKHKHSEATS